MQPEEGEQTPGGPERKSEVTLKTIGPLPGHSPAHCIFTSFSRTCPLSVPPLLCMFQDASAVCLGADGRDEDGTGMVK